MHPSPPHPARRAENETSGYDSQGVLDALSPLGVMAVDVTGDEMAKTHSCYLVNFLARGSFGSSFPSDHRRPSLPPFWSGSSQCGT
eukprot:3646786-Prymnesium_polylepis.2